MNQQTVVLVGQPNVGKSALFNRLAGRTISIVHDQPGVTRDWISAPCPALGKDCAIVDTGGIGAEPDPDFARQTTAAAQQAMEKADLIVLVVDGRMGMTPLDHELARMLRAWGKSVFLAVNKIDTSKHDDFTSEFHGLGFSSVFPVSAAHGRGVGDLIEGIKVALKTEEATEEDVRPKDPHIALIGRPNAGKSSLVNRIFGEGRTIVSEIPGTTRDTVDISYTRKDETGERTYIFCDTAGMRHRSRHRTPVEVFSTMRSEKAIRRADVCVLIMDVTEGVTAQDKKIGGLIQEAGKAAVIVLNKWDLVKWDGTAKDIRKKLFDSVREKLFFLPYAPILTLSAKSGESVSRLFSALDEIQENAKLTIGTGELNRLLKLAMERQPPPMKKNRRFKILYATQVDHSVERDFLPPEFIAFVNDLDLLDPGYATYLERAIRATHAYPGLPIKFHFREREKK